MSFFELAKDRYSVRRFDQRPVKQETVNKILAAGLLAPTACNNQPYRILVINSEDALNKLQRCTECHFNAPLAMLVCYDKQECWRRQYDNAFSGEVDVSIVTTHLMLAAHELGVGSTWVMYFIPDALRCEFEIPESLEPVALLVMGYPASEAKPSRLHDTFRPEGEIVFFNTFK